MSEAEFIKVLEISLCWTGILILTGVSAGLKMNRYNRSKKLQTPIEQTEGLNVKEINKPNKGRAKKRS